MENQYNIRHAREILEPAAPAGYLLFDDNGVWPGEAVKKQDEQDDAEFLRWRPADHLQHRPDATEPASTPMLPNPFNARELAAFMLGGTGAWVRCEYGEWADGPSQERLNRIDRQSYARRALIEAYAAYREAERVVGSYPSELAAVADRAREAYNIANMEANLREGVSDSIPGTEDSRVRRERAKSSIAALDSEMEAANEAAQIASETWLTAMVVCLLEKPQAATEAPAAATSAAAQEQGVATPTAPSARETPETEWHLMATADQLCAAFGVFTGMNKDWFANLKDRPALKAARFQPGQGGRDKREPFFYVYPVLQWLLDDRRKTGTKMQEATGWRMLKKHFPKVYEAYETSAPDPD